MIQRKVRFLGLSALCLFLVSIFSGCLTTDYVGEVPEKLELAVPFTDNMILQRQKLVPAWGFAVPGDTITVEFAGQSKSATADRKGDWMVKLDPLEASKEGRDFVVRSELAPAAITLKDVLVGEVWFSSGQSNMVWIAGKSMVRELANELAKSENEVLIREININTVSALYPQKRATSDEGWKKISKASGFSALSLAFAHELYQQLDVPIGILLSAHSNTRVEAFAKREAFEAHPELEKDVELIHKADPRLEEGRAAFDQYYKDLAAWQTEAGKMAEMGGNLPDRPNLPGIAGMWRGPSQFFNGKINPVVPYAIRGAIWCQGTSNSRDGKIYAARMEALLNGWREAWDMPEMPFYFTQMQAYGAGPDPDSVGFADIRQAQHLFFINNRDNVGMVVQSDLNSARPGGIHYFNKLHPGMRMARWALANEYGEDIAKTGPIFAGVEIVGDKAIVSFEEDSLYGGLIVGSKGMGQDYRDPEKYFEPARPTPGEELNHFRLCGPDRKWHAAEAKIVGDTVEVRSKEVPNPVGVQYAYSAVPMNSNLYNKAGLPTTPFAVIDGEFIFEEDNPAVIAAEKAREARRNDPNLPYFQLAEYYRDGAVIQRGQPIPVWGHANEGAEVTVTLGEVTKKATANDLQQWSLTLPAFKASTEPLTMTVETSKGSTRTVKDILVGDVWYLTGGSPLRESWPFDRRDAEARKPAPMPLVREFLIKTKATTNPSPRKRGFEIGGGRFRSNWATADYSDPDQGVTGFAYHFAKALNRPGIPQGVITMASGRSGRSASYASPLSWTSFEAVKDIDNPAFEERMEQLLLQYPNSAIAKAAVEEYLVAVKEDVRNIIEADEKGIDMSSVIRRFPGFPGPDREVTRGGTVPTYTYNWCVSPLTPMAVAGVVWVPA
ncbi:MAG TPA: sialate O-acetylesterase, partial [Opitutales bacterium]|nr:sialate O-acetylesterase [Opitutales bacterium]